MSPVVERAALVLGVGALWAAGYFGLGSTSSSRAVRSLTTAIDGQIPFIGWSVWSYLLGLWLIVMPVWVVSSRSLIRKTAIAYCAVLLISFGCFLAYPVTSLGLRPEAPLITAGTVSGWALHALYAIDPPYNLFPSLHVSLGVVAAYSMSRASRPLGTIGFAIAALVAISACTVKQHFAWDIVAGAVLGGLTGLLILREREATEDAD